MKDKVYLGIKCDEIDMKLDKFIESEIEEEDISTIIEDVHSRVSNIYKQNKCIENQYNSLKREDRFREKRGKRRSISAFELANMVMEKERFIISNSNIYIYISKCGFYKLIKDGEVDSIIRNIIPKELKSNIRSNTINECIKWIRSTKEIYMEINQHANLINFKNGYYDIRSGRFYKDDRSDKIFDYYVNTKFKRNCSDGINFEMYMNNITNSDEQLKMLLQEVIGVALSNIRGFKRAIFIIGQPNSGKSTFLDLLGNLIGNQFCSGLSMIDLNDKYRLAELANKRLNTCGEVSEKSIKRLDIFKSLTGNDIVMAEQKGQNPFKLKNNALLVFAGNYLPELTVTDTTNAFFKRLVIIPFNTSIASEKQDFYLMEKLMEEKQYIIRFALDGLNRFIKNNQQFTRCSSVDQITKEYMYENASFQMFIEERCLVNGRGKITSRSLVEVYEEFCYDKGVTPISNRQFHKYMKRLQNVQYTRFRCDEGNCYGYRGISVNI